MTRPPPQGKAAAVSDAGAGNLVDRFAPAALLPYLRLARADRPIGFFLLALPCFWSVSLAARSLGEAYPDPWLLFLFAVGAIVMRGAGCTYNDLVDRDIDAKVARTRARPLPSGQVSPRAAILFMLALCLIGLAVLLSFNSLHHLAWAWRVADRGALSLRQAVQLLAASRARARLQLGRAVGLGLPCWGASTGRRSSSMRGRSAGPSATTPSTPIRTARTTTSSG